MVYNIQFQGIITNHAHFMFPNVLQFYLLICLYYIISLEIINSCLKSTDCNL